MSCRQRSRPALVRFFCSACQFVAENHFRRALQGAGRILKRHDAAPARRSRKLSKRLHSGEQRKAIGAVRHPRPASSRVSKPCSTRTRPEGARRRSADGEYDPERLTRTPRTPDGRRWIYRAALASCVRCGLDVVSRDPSAADMAQLRIARVQKEHAPVLDLEPHASVDDRRDLGGVLRRRWGHAWVLRVRRAIHQPVGRPRHGRCLRVWDRMVAGRDGRFRDLVHPRTLCSLERPDRVWFPVMPSIWEVKTNGIPRRQKTRRSL